MNNHSLMLQAAISVWLACVSQTALAQTVVVAYVLDDVWLLPDISHPREPAQQMTGTFEWTYEEGDFENGSGQFIECIIPWYGSEFEALDINIDVTSTEFVLPGNLHDLGLDVTLFLVEPLMPDQASMIDTTRSMFDIQHGISHKGHVVSGSIVPSFDMCPADFNGDGQSNLADFSLLLGCMSGPAEQPLLPGCEPADVNVGGAVNLADFATFQAGFGCVGFTGLDG